MTTLRTLRTPRLLVGIVLAFATGCGGGAPPPRMYLHEAIYGLGGGRVFVNNTYGQTETGSAWTSAMIGATPTRPGSCGHPLPGYRSKVLREDGSEAKPGELFDRDGQLWVTGRIDDVIDVAGHRLGTMELEAALVAHPAVSEAAVVTRPDDVKGTVPIAFVVPRAGYADSAQLQQELALAVVEAVGAIARPAAVHVVPTVPRTRSGKIMRRVLRDLVTNGEAAGDLTSLENPDAIDVVKAKLAAS